MKTVKQFFQMISISWKKVIIIFLAGVMILTTTACGSSRASATYNGKTNPVTDAKAERLVQEAQQNVKKHPNPLKEVVPDKSLEEQAKDLNRSVQKTAKEMTESAQRSIKKAPEQAQERLETLQENVKGAIDQAKDAARYSSPS